VAAARVAAERAAVATVAEATVVARAGAMVAAREAGWGVGGWAGAANTRPQSHWPLARVAAEGASRAVEPAVEAWVAAWAVAAGPRAVAARAAAGAPAAQVQRYASESSVWGSAAAGRS
jgi:hypothetical protein